MSTQDTTVTVPTETRKSTEDVFYGEESAKGIATQLGWDMEKITAKLELDEKQSAELARSTGEALQAVGLSQEESQQYFAVFRQLVLKPATDEQRDAWRYEAQLAANEKYGVKEAKARIAKVNAYVRGDPRLKEQLQVGVGSHPKIVAMMLERAHELRLPKRSK